MFDSLQGINLFPASPAEIFMNITVALLCGLFISWLYRLTYKGPGYSHNFVSSLILLTMITSVVIMVIGNSLARAFGLVGAMSIIRFRTAVKETRDIVYLFFGLSVGLAAGVGYYQIAIIGTLFIGIILLALSRSSVSMTTKKEYLLQFSYSENGDDSPPYLPVLDKYCRRHKVINVKTYEDQDLVELSYYVKLRHEERNSQFMRELKNTRGVGHINLYFDNEEF